MRSTLTDLKPWARGGVDHEAGLLLALDAVDGLLHVGVEVLDADAHAVEAQLGEQRDGGLITLRGSTSMEYFAIRDQREVLAHDAHQLAQLVVGQEGRRAAAQVQLQDFPRAIEAGHLEIHFLFKVSQVLCRAAVILGDDLVAGAVVADRIAERDVEV